MRNLFFSLLLIFVYATNTQSQTSDLNLISTAGAYFETENFSLSWSLGEVLTESLESDSYILTQGFQQGGDYSTRIPFNIVHSCDFVIYPNPASQSFNLEFLNYESNFQEVFISLFDISGQMVMKKQVDQLLNTMDISILKSGTYFVKVEGVSAIEKKVLILEKINY